MNTLRTTVAISILLGAFGTLTVGSASADHSFCVDGPEFEIYESCVGYSADQGAPSACVYGWEQVRGPKAGAMVCGGGSCVYYNLYFPGLEGCLP